MLHKIKGKITRKKAYSLETYTLVRGVQIESEKSIILEDGKTLLSDSQYSTWEYLRQSTTLEDAFLNMNKDFANIISLDIFKDISSELMDRDIVYASTSESDICSYIEKNCKIVVNAELVSDMRNKVFLRHLGEEKCLTTREYTLLKSISTGEYEAIDVNHWDIFFSLYKKEAISFI